MNITQESTGELSATIKIELDQNDYQEKVNNSLKDLQRKSALKGFRPGKAPFGLVKKMYEKSVVAEEVNRLLSDSLSNYITENKLEILGYPLGNDEKNNQIDFENSTEFSFYFDIAFTPEVKPDISENTIVDYFTIKVEDQMVENYLEDIRHRHGNFIESDTIEPGDIIEGEIAELDESGEIKENGIKHITSIFLNFIKDEQSKQSFIGKKTGEKVIFNPLKATENIIEATTMLGIKKEESEKAEYDYQFTILKISRTELAAMDSEFYKKIYPNLEINDEADFRKQLVKEVSDYYKIESDKYFVHTAKEKLVDETKFNLSEDFIKRWLVDSDKNLTPEFVEKNYHKYERSLRQQLIINSLMKDHNINVEEQEMKDYVRQIFIKRYFKDQLDEEKSSQIDSIVESVLKNKEESAKIFDLLFDDKIRDLFLSKLKLDRKEVTYPEFINIANEHHKTHHHEHD